MQISPVSPKAISSAEFSRSKILMVTPGSGMPQEPAFDLP